ncbi:MAG: hypothetical protein HYZ15_16195 [Sphingobacteriales bacterium]|nr:hypothetical protein [Sphingobacteriales bacterium]
MRSISEFLFYGLSGITLLMLVIRFTLYRSRRLHPWIAGVLILYLLTTLLYFYYPAPGGGSGKDKQDTGNHPAIRASSRLILSLDSLVDAYTGLVDEAARDIPGNMEQSGQQLLALVNRFDIEELLQDTLLYDSVDQSLGNMESELAAIIADPDLAEKKASLNMLSGEFRSILQATGYKQKPLYWLQSAAAFGPEHPGYWLSADPRKKGPYGQPDTKIIERINEKDRRLSTNTK